ncbi:MAG: hypothetical protein ABR874_02480 [Candidatus Sulfotelmatobacter sp.]|jgi:hypothetical protein
MAKPFRLMFCAAGLLLLSSCSPRDYLTRRLAADLIAGSTAFRPAQNFELRTGVISNKDYLTPEYLALQHHGWISSNKAACPPAVESPCVEVTLTPSGVDTLQGIIPPSDAEKQSFTIPAARRELVAVTGISKQGIVASVEFTWHWVPLNEIGAAIYPSDARYRSYAAFREYDDGWRVIVGAGHPGQPLDDALKNAEPAP